MKRVLLLLLLMMTVVGFAQRPGFDPEPSLEVSVDKIYFGEVPQNQSVTKYVRVTGQDLGDAIVVSLDGQYANNFSFVKATGWDDYKGGILLVTYTASMSMAVAPPFAYDASLTISSGQSFIHEIYLNGAIEGMYYIYSYYPNDTVFPMNSVVPITGMVMDVQGMPVVDAEVEVSVSVLDTKRTFYTSSDSTGVFSVSFEPTPYESGFYTVHSGRVGNTSTDVDFSFRIPGMSLGSTGNILCTFVEGYEYSDSILIKNKSDIFLTNIFLSSAQTPAPSAYYIESGVLDLGPMEEAYLVYSIGGSVPTSTGHYDPFDVFVESDQGARAEFTAWCYCKAYEEITAFPKNIVTTMIPGENKILDVMLVNTTYYESGTVHCFLDDASYYAAIVGCDSLPSIMPHDTAYVSIRFSPEDDCPLTTFYTSLFVNTDVGYTQEVPIQVTAVTEPLGSLVIDVTDDYTWVLNKADEPHVANAEVTVNGYHSLEMVAQDSTNSQGLLQLSNLSEGYYRLTVSAGENHAEYSGIVHVVGGMDSDEDVYLQNLPVNYTWIAKPTGSGDEYTYELVVDYDAGVPVPVLTIEHSGIHELSYGDSDNFKIVITNHGSESASKVEIRFSESSEYTFAPLYDIVDQIPPSGKVEIPGTYFRSYTPATPTDADCDVHISTICTYLSASNDLGYGLAQNRSLPFDLGTPATCQPAATTLNNGIPSVNNSSDTPFSSDDDSVAVDESTPAIGERFDTPCLDALADAMDDCLPADLPLYNLVTSLENATTSISSGGPYATEQTLLEQLSSFAEMALNESNGGLWDVKDCLESVYTGLDGCATRSNLADIQSAINGLYHSTFYYYNEFMFVKSIFSAEIWNNEANVVAFVKAFKALINSSTGLVSSSDANALAASFVGTNVKDEDILAFVERWNRSVEYWSNGYFVVADLPPAYNTDFIQIDNSLINEMVAIEDQYPSYFSLSGLYTESLTAGKAFVENRSKMNSSIKKSFSKKSAMTGEALVETFTIHNGSDSSPMQSIGLDFVVKDENGVDRTDWFDISTVSLKQISGIDGSGVVGAGKDGTVKIQFVPSKQAAPTVSKVYYFGGTFSFTDPYTSSSTSHNMYPVAITVNPGPDLHVDFFMPHDIIGDDTLTLGKREPNVAAELGVIINNKGVVTAENVTLETAVPEIRNYNGYDIDFAFDSAMFNGNTRSLGLKEILFGNIGSAKISVGEWVFTSDQLGHFESYDAHIIHNSSSGVSDLSLVSHKEIHELIHPIFAYGSLDDGINDFLVNDVPDANNYPDSIYFSHGGRTAVKTAQGIGFDHYVEPLDTIVTLTVNPASTGWYYGVTDDPGRDKYEILKCVRNSDSQLIPKNNVWETYVTLHDGADPVYENKLHIVDTLSGNQSSTYTLVYGVRSDLLHVMEITGIPTSDTEYPLATFTVSFSKSIIDTTFTYKDMTLTCEGGSNLMNPTVVITKVCDSIFTVNISQVTTEAGVYALNVNTLHVKDACGYEGFKEKQATWTQVWTDHTQTNTLTSGWNWWSPFISASSEQDLQKLTTALGANATLIKSRTNGFVTYYEGDWYGTLTTLSNREMYMINMNSDEDVSIVGPLANLWVNPITINPGWNWISFPSSVAQSVQVALSNLPSVNGDVVKSRDGSSIYMDGWSGTLSTLTPGGGYLYKYNGSEPIEFMYAPSTKDGKYPEKPNRSNHWEMSVGAYDLNATIVGVIEIEGQEQREETLAVGAFIGDRCVGQTNALYIESLDRYLVFLNFFGNPNDEITFRMYDESSGMESGVSETTALFETNAVIGTLEEPVAIRFNTVSIPEFSVKHLNLFPNPVKLGENVKVTLKGGLASGMEVEVLSSLGVQMYKAAVGSDVLELAAPMTSGVYIVKITNKDGAVYYGKLFVE